MDKKIKGAKKPKEVKFAVETMAKVKSKVKDARIAKIKNESKVENLRWMHTMD